MCKFLRFNVYLIDLKFDSDLFSFHGDDFPFLYNICYVFAIQKRNENKDKPNWKFDFKTNKPTHIFDIKWNNIKWNAMCNSKWTCNNIIILYLFNLYALVLMS